MHFDNMTLLNRIQTEVQEKHVQLNLPITKEKINTACLHPKSTYTFYN